MDGIPAIHHDPHGPVLVAPDVPLPFVRDALGGGTWIARPGGEAGCALMVSRDPDWVAHSHAAGVPCASASDDAALMEQLRAFDDGALITTREGELLSWITAIRDEEERNQRAHEEHVDQRVEVLQARVDVLNAHIDAMERTRAWRFARRLGEWKSAALRLVRPRRGG